MADIFISYTNSDRDWAFWIAHELEVLGHVPHVHEWEIPAGGDIMAWMDDRYHAADHILCVVSKAYLEAPYSSLERRAAQWAALSYRPGFALPVFVERCEASTLFATLKRCDVYGLSEEDARVRLRTFLAPVGKPAQPPRFPGARMVPQPEISAQPAAPFPGKEVLSNFPVTSRRFRGRDDARQRAETYVDDALRESGSIVEIDERFCFVIMSFSSDPQLSDFYDHAIKPTVQSAGYRCERVDEQHFNDSISDRILLNIRRAKFIIADMTEARPNCYYELGIAHAMNKVVIHLCRDARDIHFDVKDFNFIIYSRIDDLKRKLAERIDHTVR